MHMSGIVPRESVALSPVPSLGHVALSTGTLPESGSDDWHEVLSDTDETDGDVTNNPSELSLVMPRMLMSQLPVTGGAGKLKVIVVGRKSVGKTTLVETLMTEFGCASSSPRVSGGLMEYVMGPPHDQMAIVDTSGYLTPTDACDTIDTLTGYLDALYHETASLVNGLNPNTVAVVSEGRSLAQFPHVDVCLFLLDPRQDLNPDLLVMQTIAQYTAVVPVLAQSDELSNIPELKEQTLAKIELSLPPLEGLPLAISSLTKYNDDMTMSAVMQDSYQSQVPVESDLCHLISLLDGNAAVFRSWTAQRFRDWVASMHLRSTINDRLSQPALFKFVEIDLGEWSIVQDAASRAITRREGTSNQRNSGSSRRNAGSIYNVDPLDINKWARTLKILFAVAAAAFGAVGLHFATTKAVAVPPPPPPPKKLPAMLEDWIFWLRITLIN